MRRDKTEERGAKKKKETETEVEMKKRNGTEDLRRYCRDGSKGIKNKRKERGEAKHTLKCGDGVAESRSRLRR